MNRPIFVLTRIWRRLAKVLRKWRKIVHDEPAIHRSAAWWTKHYQKSATNLLLAIWAVMAVAVGFQHFMGGLADWSNTSPACPYVFTVEVNTVSWPELTCLPGIGEVLAKRIVNTRSEIGPFSRCEDLLFVRGIGPKTVEKIRPFLRFDKGSHCDEKGPVSD